MEFTVQHPVVFIEPKVQYSYIHNTQRTSQKYSQYATEKTEVIVVPSENKVLLVSQSTYAGVFRVRN
jgi:hypothetical protein